MYTICSLFVPLLFPMRGPNNRGGTPMKNKNYLPEYVQRQKTFPHLRWKLVHRADKNAIYIKDSFYKQGLKRISLHPYRKDVASHCETIWEQIKKTGDKDWGIYFDTKSNQKKKHQLQLRGSLTQTIPITSRLRLRYEELPRSPPANSPRRTWRR